MDRKSFFATIIGILALPFVGREGDTEPTFDVTGKATYHGVHQVWNGEEWVEKGRYHFQIREPIKDRERWIQENIYRPYREET